MSDGHLTRRLGSLISAHEASGNGLFASTVEEPGEHVSERTQALEGLLAAIATVRRVTGWDRDQVIGYIRDCVDYKPRRALNMAAHKVGRPDPKARHR